MVFKQKPSEQKYNLSPRLFIMLLCFIPSICKLYSWFLRWSTARGPAPRFIWGGPSKVEPCLSIWFTVSSREIKIKNIEVRFNNIKTLLYKSLIGSFQWTNSFKTLQFRKELYATKVSFLCKMCKYKFFNSSRVLKHLFVIEKWKDVRYEGKKGEKILASKRWLFDPKIVLLCKYNATKTARHLLNSKQNKRF